VHTAILERKVRIEQKKFNVYKLLHNNLMGVQKVTLDKGGLEPAEDFSVFYGKKYKNH